MPKDTITFAINGEVELVRFSTAVSIFENLVIALSKEYKAEGIKWIVHDLQISSAIATVRGESDVMEEVERIVNAYEDVGHSLQSRQRINHTEPVVKAANEIVSILGDKVTGVRFETADQEYTFTGLPGMVLPGTTIIKSFGAIEGRIQTLSNRKGLRFVLFDTLNDRAVSCYLPEGQEEKMRESWGKMAIVEGEISREKETGRPLAIRHVSDIKVLSEPQRGSYLKARGIAPRMAGAPLAEEIVRELRDA